MEHAMSSTADHEANTMPLRHGNTPSVRACANVAGIDLQRAKAAMLAADRYWIVALRLDNTTEFKNAPGYRPDEVAELRRRHPDVFGRRRTKPPSARRLATYLRRTANLTAEEATRFIIAHADHLNAKADVLVAQMQARRTP